MINKKLGNYIITSLIAEGGMSYIYKAEHEFLNTIVVIKVLREELITSENIKERFIKEAKILASLKHDNIVKIYDFYREGNILAIVMEYLEGETLLSYIQRKKLMNDEIVNIFLQVLDAFEYAHELGIVHRDIKPSNIFITKDNKVKILDFGIAKIFGTGLDSTLTGTQIGTPIYMSPEQVKGDKSIDHRSDIYSLGVTLYNMVYGKPPYKTTTSIFEIYNRIVFEPLPDLDKENIFTPIIEKATKKDREERFQNISEFKDAILNLNPNSQQSTVLQSRAKNSSIPRQVPKTSNQFMDNTHDLLFKQIKTNALTYGKIGILLLLTASIPYFGNLAIIVSIFLQILAYENLSRFYFEKKININYILGFAVRYGVILVAILLNLLEYIDYTLGFEKFDYMLELAYMFVKALNGSVDDFGFIFNEFELILYNNSFFLIFLIIYAATVIGSYFEYKSKILVSEKTGVSAYKTSGALNFYGSIGLVAFSLGFLAIYISKIVELVAFFKTKNE